MVKKKITLGICSVVIALITLVLVMHLSSETVQPYTQKNFGEMKNCHNREPFDSIKLANCTFGRDGKTIYLVGDSTANMYSSTIYKLSQELQYRLVLMTAPSCLPMTKVHARILPNDKFLPPYDYTEEFNHCPTFNENLEVVLKQTTTSDVIIYSFLDQYFWDNSFVFTRNGLVVRNKSLILEDMFNRMRDFKATKVYLLPPPNFRLVNNGKWEFQICRTFDEMLGKCGLKISKMEVQDAQHIIRKIINRYKSASFKIVDTTKLICNLDCKQFQKGDWNFRDFTHLTNHGASLFRTTLTQILSQHF